MKTRDTLHIWNIHLERNATAAENIDTFMAIYLVHDEDENDDGEAAEEAGGGEHHSLLFYYFVSICICSLSVAITVHFVYEAPLNGRNGWILSPSSLLPHMFYLMNRRQKTCANSNKPPQKTSRCPATVPPLAVAWTIEQRTRVWEDFVLEIFPDVSLLLLFGKCIKFEGTHESIRDWVMFTCSRHEFEQKTIATARGECIQWHSLCK